MNTITRLLAAAGLAAAAFLVITPASAAGKLKHKPAPAKAAAAEVLPPEVADHVKTDYACELGNTVTIYNKAGDDGHIDLSWHKQMHQLARVATTTGALRYENPEQGLVWIGIPSKGILLDSKAGHQLANECQSPEQRAAAAHPDVVQKG